MFHHYIIILSILIILACTRPTVSKENCNYTIIQICDLLSIWDIQGGMEECEISIMNNGVNNLDTVWFDLKFETDNKINSIIKKIKIITELPGGHIMSYSVNIAMSSSSLPIARYVLYNRESSCK